MQIVITKYKKVMKTQVVQCHLKSITYFEDIKVEGMPFISK